MNNTKADYTICIIEVKDHVPTKVHLQIHPSHDATKIVKALQPIIKVIGDVCVNNKNTGIEEG